MLQNINFSCIKNSEKLKVTWIQTHKSRTATGYC